MPRSNVLDRVIVQIALAGGVLRAADVLRAIPEIPPNNIYNSMATAVRAKRPKLKRGAFCSYRLTAHGVRRANRLGVPISSADVRERKKNAAKGIRERRRRREARRGRDRHFLAVWQTEGRVVQPRGTVEFRRRPRVYLDLPVEMIEEMKTELRRMGRTRGMSALLQMAWRIARATIMAWPTLKRPAAPARQRAFSPPAFDPPRRGGLEPPVFSEILKKKTRGIQEAEKRARRAAYVADRCMAAVELLKAGPAGTQALIAAMGTTRTMGYARLRAAVAYGFIERHSMGVYSLPGAHAVPSLRTRIALEVALEAKSIAEVAHALGESKTRVKDAMRALVAAGRVVRAGVGSYRSRPR